MLFKIAWAVLFLTTAGIAVESPGISTYWYKGNQVDVQTLDGVTVQASVMNLGKYNRVDIRVLNKATGPVTVQPESVALTITGDEHDVDLAQLSERDVDRSVSRDLLVGNLLNGFVASASAQITTAGVMALDYPDAKAARFHPSRAEAAAARREQISELLLQRVTVLPNQAAIGSVFFRGPSKLDGALVTIGLGTRLYNLPFGIGSPASSVASLALNSAAPAAAGASAPEGDVAQAVTPEIEQDGNPLYYVLGIAGQASHVEGFEITAITPYSPAARAGLRAQDDTILAINGVRVRSAEQINRLLASGEPSKVTVTVMHQYWQEEKVIALH